MPAKTAAATPATPHSISEPLVTKAVTSLLSSLAKDKESSSDLLSGDSSTAHVSLTFHLSKANPNANSTPIRLDCPHTVLDEDGDGEDRSVCLFVKDESKAWVKEFVEATPSLSYVTKIMTLTTLRKNYAQYEQRRELLHSFTSFLADDRILPMLSKCLGKSFYNEKKLPVAIKLTRKESLKHTIVRAVEKSTYLYIGGGTSISLKVGRPSRLNTSSILANIFALVPQVVNKVGGWGKVSGIGVMCGQSVNVPVYARTTTELRELEGMMGVVVKPLKVREEVSKVVTPTSTKRKAEESKLSKAVKKAKDVKLKEAADKMAVEVDERVEEVIEELKEEAEEEEEEEKEEEEKPKKKSRKEVRAEKQPEERPVSKSKQVAGKPEKKVKAAEKEEKVEKASKKVAEKNVSSDFVATKKFAGARKGMKFCTGAQGLGYYKDIPFKYDAMFAASLKQQFGGGGGGRGKKTPTKGKGSPKGGG